VPPTPAANTRARALQKTQPKPTQTDPTHFRRIAFVGSDGRTRHFLLQSGQTGGPGHADERLLQLMRLANALLDRQPDSRKRGLAWHAPAIVPVWPALRLVEEEPSYASYYEAYEVRALLKCLALLAPCFCIPCYFAELKP
jgi:hypothetical protein